MTKLAISGALGRMGQRVIALAKEDREVEVVCALERNGHPGLGLDIGAGVRVRCDLEGIAVADVLIEFSSPQASMQHLLRIAPLGKKMVIGTTGFSPQQASEIKQAAENIAVVFAPNMSVGVNILFSLVSQAAQRLKAAGYSVEISEAHHIHKKDAPSGTAKRLAAIVNEQGFSLDADKIEAVREGEIIGDHKVVFQSEWDRLELSHSAKTRGIFVRGALQAAKWLADKPAGLYGMGDVIG
ncbi:MAG: 4-hydroxy-tetrahydrodipicolinate reductase [Candidatus Omnitrophota bacterium]